MDDMVLPPLGAVKPGPHTNKYGTSPNSAARRFELDPTWQVMRLLSWVGTIRITTPQRAVYPEPHGSRAAA